VGLQQAPRECFLEAVEPSPAPPFLLVTRCLPPWADPALADEASPSPLRPTQSLRGCSRGEYPSRTPLAPPQPPRSRQGGPSQPRDLNSRGGTRGRPRGRACWEGLLGAPTASNSTTASTAHRAYAEGGVVRRCKGEGRNQRATRRQDAGASQGSDEGKHWGEGDGEARIRRGGPAWGPPPICAPCQHSQLSLCTTLLHALPAHMHATARPQPLLRHLTAL
jgi:hypothetical protein